MVENEGRHIQLGGGRGEMSGRILNKYDSQMENKLKPLFTRTEYLTHAHPHTRLGTCPHGALFVLLLMHDYPSLTQSKNSGRAGKRKGEFLCLRSGVLILPVQPCPPAGAASDIYHLPPSRSQVNYLSEIKRLESSRINTSV